MHELSIAQSVIDSIRKNIPSDLLPKADKVKLQIGKLSGIELDALTYSFGILVQNTEFPQLAMEIEQIEGKVLCQTCGTEFTYNKYGIPCPQCGGFSVKIIDGKQMKIINITMK